MTTSLANFIASLTAGALVLSAIGIALIIAFNYKIRKESNKKGIWRND